MISGGTVEVAGGASQGGSGGDLLLTGGASETGASWQRVDGINFR